MDSKLKKCPLCGGEAEVFLGDDWYVECKSCLANTTHYSVKADAIAAWNQRADAPMFTREELEAIGSLVFRAYPNGGIMSEVEHSILAKCEAALKGAK